MEKVKTNARTTADKVQTKETNIPDDAVARAKPSVLKMMKGSKKSIETNTNKINKTSNKETR